MSTKDGRAAVQTYRLTYIAHNVIDAIENKASSELGTSVQQPLQFLSKQKHG